MLSAYAYATIRIVNSCFARIYKIRKDMVNIMQIDIRCEYCGVEYDYKINKICPHCGGVPSGTHATEAKKQALALARAARAREAESAAAANVPAAGPAAAAAPTGRFMRCLIKLLPVWLLIIVLSFIIPAAAQHAVSRSAAANLQEIHELPFVDYAMGEQITIGIYDLTVMSAKLVNDSRICDILPEGYALLAVRMSGTAGSFLYEDYLASFGSYNNTPYVTDGSTCYRRVDDYALKSYDDSFAQNPFTFFSLGPGDPSNGYMCYIVKADFDHLYLCLEEFETLYHTKHLTRVNRVRLEIGGDKDV